MQHSFIPPSSREFNALFLDGISRGGGLSDIKIFYPSSFQRARRGGGIFNFLSGLAKKAVPFLMRNVAPEVVSMGKNVLSDALEGRRIRETLKERGIEALKGVGKRIVRGGGKRRKSKRKKNRVLKRKRQLKRKIARNCYKNDIFSSRLLV